VNEKKTLLWKGYSTGLAREEFLIEVEFIAVLK